VVLEMMHRPRFIRLLRWEIKEYLSLPILIFLIASAIIAVLTMNSSNVNADRNYINLYEGSGTVFIILTLIASAFFSRIFAGSIGRGEVKLMLSYPIKRWHLFISKFTAMFLTVFAIYSLVFSFHLYLSALSIFEPMFYLSLFAFFLQLLLACGVSVAISMVTKNEVMSLLAAVIMLLGIDNLVGYQSYVSAEGRFRFLFQYFGELTHGSLPFGKDFVVNSGDIVVAILLPVSIFVLSLIFSFTYFTRVMEVD
jgi:ABC-type transport system involved in multi-copper enzyme maturation permease subunit